MKRLDLQLILALKRQTAFSFSKKNKQTNTGSKLLFWLDLLIGPQSYEMWKRSLSKHKSNSNHFFSVEKFNLNQGKVSFSTNTSAIMQRMSPPSGRFTKLQAIKLLFHLL